MISILVQFFFHMNVSSLCHNFDGLHSLLARMNIKSKITSTTETRLKNILLEI